MELGLKPWPGGGIETSVDSIGCRVSQGKGYVLLTKPRSRVPNTFRVFPASCG